MESESNILVKFRLKGAKKSEIAYLSYFQYSNMKDLPITLECKIVENQKPTLSKSDVKLLEEKLANAFAQSKSHTHKLSNN